MGRLDRAISIIVDTYMENCEGDGKKPNLKKSKLEELLNSEIQNRDMEEKLKPDEIKRAVRLFEKKKGDSINCREFCRCLSFLIVRYYRIKTGKSVKGEKGKKKGKGGKKGEDEENDSEEEEEEDEE